MLIHAKGVFMGKKIQRILIALKEKQKNNDSWKGYIYI